MKERDESHGSPFDRGSADAYYGRPRDPHSWPYGTYKGTRVELADMTVEQIEDYHAGYQDTLDSGESKDWGNPE